MRKMWRRRLDEAGRDRGEGTIEYVGLVVIAALLITTSVGAVALFPGNASTAACRLVSALSGGDGAACGQPDTPVAEPADDMDFHPGVCMLSETSESYNAEVKIWFFKVSDSSGFIVQEFSDGTVRATLTDGAGVGVNGSLGSKTFDAGKLGDGDNAGVNVSLGGGLDFEYGSTWQFDDRAQWERMESQLDDYLIQQVSLRNDRHGGYALWLALSGGFVDPPKDPSVTYGKIGLEVALRGNAGTRLPGPTGPDGKTTYIDPKLGVNGSLTAGGSVVVQKNHDTGEESHTYQLDGKVTLGGSMIVGHATGEGSVAGAFTTTYGPDGELTKIALKSTYEIGGSAHLGNDTFKAVSGKLGEGETRSVVTTTTLDVTDDNRALVQSWMADHATGRTLALPFSAMVPDQPSADPFMQLMYDEAKMSRIEYHNVRDTWEFGMAVKKGWEFGFNVSATEATATKTEAEFLGAPGPDATRTLVDDALCN